jgi:Protein of unknown function (DUF3617)
MKNIFLGMVWLGAMSSATVLAAGSDELWEVSATMEMPGMVMPAHTTKVCIKKGKEKDPNNAVPKNRNKDCKMIDVNISGNKSSWKMKCNGENPMTGSGEITFGNGTYSGRMKMHSEGGDVTMAYEGKSIGTCQAK